MKIAVEGCAHGDLDKIYDVISTLEKENGINVDLVICCGDFQSVRCLEDLECMAVPPKYREMKTFYKYYSGEKVAPYLTIFIGGNHEASNYLGELAYGGWVCPKIYYLGYAGVININGIRIAGLSGIYKGPDYLRGHFEVSPFTEYTKRSAYHIRAFDVFRLKQISQPLDIALSHDWPRGIYHYGNVQQLLRRKPFFKSEIANNTLGSRPAQDLLEKLQPNYWFSAHLHVKYAAVVQHNNEEDKIEMIKSTKFLALDKCLPKRQFLQILDVGPELGASESPEIFYDLEWLTILRNTDHLLSVTPSIHYMPGPGCQERWNFQPTEEELRETKELMGGDLKVPANFSMSVAAYDPTQATAQNAGINSDVLKAKQNSQTIEFCRKLGITDPIGKILDSMNTQTSSSLLVDEFCGCADDGEAGVTLIDDPNNLTCNVSGDVEDMLSDNECDEDSSAKNNSNMSTSVTENMESISMEIKDEPLQTSTPTLSTDNRSLTDGPPSKLKRRNLAVYKTNEESTMS
ncbi:lariat debranching enzyme [Chamberlinius hualienensis]